MSAFKNWQLNNELDRCVKLLDIAFALAEDNDLRLEAYANIQNEVYELMNSIIVASTCTDARYQKLVQLNSQLDMANKIVKEMLGQ